VITTPYGINNGGEVVGSFESALGSFHGFTYSTGVYTQLDDPNCNSSTFLTGINDAGVIVGDCEGIPFVYRKGTFTYLNDANTVIPQAVNDQGVIVGWRAVLTPVLSSFVLVSDKVLRKSFQAPGCTNTQALGISNSNVIVGTAVPTGGSTQQAFIEQDGTFSFYQYPNAAPSLGTIFSGLNQSGIAVGYLNTSGVNAPPSLGFVYQNETFTSIQPPFDATSSGAFAINDSGVIVGSYTTSTATFGYIATPQL